MDEKEVRGERLMSGASPTEHSLSISNREQAQVMGVMAVESFDDEEIILETVLGTLTIRGEELSIKQLDLESGRFAVDGYIVSCVYSAPRARGVRGQKARGFLERLLK